MSYGNQRDHKYLDRKVAKELLLMLLESELETSQGPLTREEKLAELLARCDSDLEREWLRLIDAHKGHLPTTSQFIVEAAQCKPDFIYRVQSVSVAVFIDGPHHDDQSTQLRDEKATENLENLGWMVHRFNYTNQSEWMNLVREAPSVYGVDQ
jgi:very-short-patch-repair endonuclease